MSYKNSIKLLTSNFDLVWKQLLFMLILSLLTFGVSYGIALPTINLLKDEGVLKQITNIFETLYTAPKEVAETLSNAFTNLYETISLNFDKIWASIIGSIFVSIFVYKLIQNMSFYNLSSLMHLKMTSFVSIGYTRNFISQLGQSVRYGFAKCVYDLPFFILKIFTLTTYLNLANTAFGVIFGLFIVSLILILLHSVEQTLFIGFACKMHECHGTISAFKAFFEGNKVIFKNFLRNFSSTIIITLTIMLVNCFLGVFTIGSGLLISLPASMVLYAIFNLTCYFATKGERYYLTENVLAIPVNSENEKLN